MLRFPASVGNDDRGRLLRRTIIRYLCLALIVTMTAVCPQVKKRFPTLTHLREAGTPKHILITLHYIITLLHCEFLTWPK